MGTKTREANILFLFDMSIEWLICLATAAIQAIIVMSIYI